ncbi:DUF4326 domain-containing protein [Streptomyces sp. NPDC093109]|uniref:DUF4326 domain-containing protein n=1 Tax=Streptomyces sp. NPDC093109 TaxID=3154977 RepID=UPI00344B84FB
MPVRRHGSARDAVALPTSCAYVGPGSTYANPFRPGDSGPSVLGGPMDEAETVGLYAATLRGPVGRRYAALFARALRGLDLVCPCPLDAPCHADVLLRLANTPDTADGDIHRTACSLEGPR